MSTSSIQACRCIIILYNAFSCLQPLLMFLKEAGGLVTLIIDWYELNRNSQFSHSRDLQEFPGKNRGPFPAMPSLEAAHLHQSIM